MKKGALLVLILLIGCVQSEDTVELSYEEYNELEDKEICGEGMHEYGDEAKIICVECFEVEHCDPDYYCEDFKCKQAPEEVYEEEIVKDPKLEGIGTCTLREECMEMLGDGAFCSKGTCYPPPDDHVKDQVECTCPDGTVVKAQLDCKYADCPGEPTEFTIKDGIVSKAIVSVSFPLLGKEAKKAAVAGCGISFEVNAPSSAYENVIPECDSAWEFKDATNPCSHKRAFVCDNKAFASCIFGGETEGAICIDGEPLEQGEFHEKFITANPLDLEQVESFSKFRSCSGHDWSGYNVNGELETERSMKHYVGEKSSVTEVLVYAPYKGTVVKIYEETSSPDFAVEIRGFHSGKWDFMFGHVYPEPGIEIGSSVEAGQLIGRKPITGPYQGTEFALVQDWSDEEQEKWIRGAPLDYMTDEILAEYAAKGITPENIIFTKEERDANPCVWAGEVPESTIELTS